VASSSHGDPIGIDLVVVKTVFRGEEGRNHSFLIDQVEEIEN
jgi:hypothetical protein